LVDGRRARERVVRIGHVNDDQGEVLSGLRAGDHVVLNPGNSLVDGIRINPR
jgi:HlyD family secretion protein